MGQLRIAEVARRTGLSAKAIRFYESQGLLPPVRRSESGYRAFSSQEVQRLHLIHRLRHLGTPLPEVRDLLDKMADADCLTYSTRILEHIQRRRSAIETEIQALERLDEELAEVESEARQAVANGRPGEPLGSCGPCPLIHHEEGGEKRMIECDCPCGTCPCDCDC